MKAFKYSAAIWNFKILKLFKCYLNSEVLAECLNTTMKVFKYLKIRKSELLHTF